MQFGNFFRGIHAGLWILLLAGSSCMVEEGDFVPRRTEAEHAVYRSVSGLDMTTVEWMRMAAGLDEWLRQSTNADREAVCIRFFPWARVYEEGANCWSLRGSERRCDFELRDGLPLGDPDAMWQMEESVGEASRSTLTLVAGGEGALSCLVSSIYGADRTSYEVAWRVHLTVSEKRFSVSASGGATIQMKGEQGGAWSVDYELTEPLVWEEHADGTTCSAVYQIRAAFAGPSERLLEFRAEQSVMNRVVITNGEVSEVW